MVSILTAMGLFYSLQKLSNIPAKGWSASGSRYLILSFISLLFIFNFYYYLNQYFVQQNYFYAKEWQYGYEKAIAEIKKIENKYDRIIVSNQPPMDQSYMFFLFYLRYLPLEYQKESTYSSGGFRENHRYGKYEFRPIDWSKEIRDGKTLFVGRPVDFPNATSLFEESYPNGEKAMLLVE